MGKITMFIGELWVVGFIILFLFAFSRAIFDEPPAGVSRLSAFFARAVIGIIWPIMMFSKGGRKSIVVILKGESENES